jgi:diacylglycerol kinase family enzyme
MIAIVLNPASGVKHRTRLRDEVEELCRDAGLHAHVRELARPDDLSVAVREALDEHPAGLVAGGGDGTVNAVASVLAGTTTPMGVLPLGTLNHFAKAAGIPLDLPEAVKTIAAGHTKRVDVGRAGDRVFVNNASIGIYPSIVESRERLQKQGRSKWAALVLATADVLRRDEEIMIGLERESTRILARTPFVFVGNNEYRVEGFGIGARARLDAGRLYAYFAPPVRTRDLPKLFAQAVFGLARRDHALQSIDGAELWADTPLARSIDVACDGELLTLTTPLHFQSCPGALLVFAPAD